MENTIAQLRRGLRSPQLAQYISPRLDDVLARNRRQAAFQALYKRQHDRPPRISAVLIALCRQADSELFLPLIVRTNSRGVHSGQIAFPGGGYEQQDDNLLQTALREALEEIGLYMPENQIVGLLPDLYIPPSHSIVTPVVGYMDAPSGYIPDPKEVAQVLEAPLAHLRDPAYIGRRESTLPDGTRFSLPTYRVHGHEVWGATAKMIAELLAFIA
jgi:8-oxo-dGTP pyrophosphatase MutT (NUDIX family)